MDYLNYISGFFDADGSISIINNKSKYKIPQISFHNTELIILENIQQYLYDNYNIKGYISKKPAKKINHKDSYDLKYVYNNAYNLCGILISFHPKKIHRINVINKFYKKVTPRNGKYSKSLKKRKLAFERLFFIVK